MVFDYKIRFIVNYLDYIVIFNLIGLKIGFLCLIIKIKYFFILFLGLFKVILRR